MNAIVYAIGLLLVGAGVFFVVNPAVMQWWSETFVRPLWIYTGLALRAVLGWVFISASATATWPGAILWLGWFMIAAAVIGTLLGPSRLIRVVRWFGRQGPSITRAWGVLAVATGIVIAVAA